MRNCLVGWKKECTVGEICLFLYRFRPLLYISRRNLIQKRQISPQIFVGVKDLSLLNEAEQAALDTLDFCVNHEDVTQPSPSAQPYVVPSHAGSHLLGQFQIAFHVVGSVGGAHRRFLRFGYFPHLALRHLLVKLI